MKKMVALILALLTIIVAVMPAYASQTYTTNASNVFFRKKASASAGYYGKLSIGASVLVYCEVPNTSYLYAKVTCSGYGVTNGVTGYIDKNYLTGFSDSQLTHPATKVAALGSSGSVIRNGASGSIVRNIQYCLYKAGKLSVTDIDGMFGNKTEAAVKAFQKQVFGTPPSHSSTNWIDGVVGNDTRDAMWVRYSSDLIAHGAIY